jgi:hypothetical protein
MTPSLAAELDRREAEADADPAAGGSWASLKCELERRLADPAEKATLSWQDVQARLRRPAP